MMLLRNYSFKEIKRMAYPMVEQAVDAVTTAVIALAVLTYKALALACEWTEALILMRRWIARQASAKWITVRRALDLIREVLELVLLVMENSFYDLIEAVKFITIVAENLFYDLIEISASAWTFRAEIIKEMKATA